MKRVHYSLVFYDKNDDSLMKEYNLGILDTSLMGIFNQHQLDPNFECLPLGEELLRDIIEEFEIDVIISDYIPFIETSIKEPSSIHLTRTP